jgi:DNA-binding transcriptional LysR family regulator
MDRFDAMRVFARIVERRSFTQAADDFGLPRSSVTDAVKELESRLGVRLLQRTTRQAPAVQRWLPYFRGAIRAMIHLSALILRRWRAKCSLSKTQVTLPSTPVFFT